MDGRQSGKGESLSQVEVLLPTIRFSWVEALCTDCAFLTYRATSVGPKLVALSPEIHMKYQVIVELDNLNQGAFMVVIRRDGKLIGTPLRDVSQKEAIQQKDMIRFSFTYGLKEAHTKIRELMDTWVSVE